MGITNNRVVENRMPDGFISGEQRFARTTLHGASKSLQGIVAAVELLLDVMNMVLE